MVVSRPLGARFNRGVFSFVLSGLRGLAAGEGEDVALPVLVDKVSCPHCGSFYMAMTLGPLRRRVDRRPFLEAGGKRIPNPAFRDTHLANPVKCPSCGRTFYIFVGVEYGRAGIRAVDVRPLPDEDEYKELVRWPHSGLVARQAIHYTPFRAAVYDSLRDLEEAVLGEHEDEGEPTMVWSLPGIGPQLQETPGGAPGKRRPQPAAVVDVNGGPPPGLG
ncbi:MAG: hypothetical protein GSR80_000757 [Desulfurococcales archaeon]|nr:hypothetical protein [Desulfurococcales archaeon]